MLDSAGTFDNRLARGQIKRRRNYEADCTRDFDLKEEVPQAKNEPPLTNTLQNSLHPILGLS
ncbi:MAG TPA: hypothetical protein DC047_02695 [Blastocatellia bacterium]|nr:hypothetical protein [Blastocatellia bacterium]